MRNKLVILLLISILVGACKTTQQPYLVEENGTVHVPAYVLPESSFLSEESKMVLKKEREEKANANQLMQKACPQPKNSDKDAWEAYRECTIQHFYTTPVYTNMLKRYKVDIAVDTIGGVYTEVFTPAEGIKETNKNKVLISLHSGAFLYGSRTFSHLESIPIAALGGIKVISIDYRVGPEHQFPAASEDVAAVYKSLLKEYEPQNIGIYGIAGGGALVAQSMAWFQKEKIPLPKAVGMISMAAAQPRPKTDSMHMISAALGFKGVAPFTYFEPYYGSNPNFNDPLLVPLQSEEVLSKFPPSLLIVSTRDFHLSSVVYTHRQLVKLGVEADLHVWEGLGHVFMNNAELSESREVFKVVVDFFKQWLS